MYCMSGLTQNIADSKINKIKLLSLNIVCRVNTIKEEDDYSELCQICRNMQKNVKYLFKILSRKTT